MADAKREIEIRLRAAGADKAAKEVAKVGEAIADTAAASEKAAAGAEHLVPAWAGAADDVADVGAASVETSGSLDSLNELQAEMRARADEARAKIDALRQATESAGRSAGPAGMGGKIAGLGRSLLHLAGGPIGLALAAIGALVGSLRNSSRTLDEVRESSDEVITTMGELLDGLDYAAATGQVDSLAAAVDSLAGIQAAANDRFAEAALRVERLADAQLELEKAQIDLAVARGDLTPAEAAARKADLDVGAMERRAAAQTEIAAAARETAAELAAEAAAAERLAAAELAAAKAAAAAGVDAAKRPVVDAANRALAGSAIGGLSNLDSGAAARAIELAGGADEVRRLIADMGGLVGTLARARLAAGESVESVLGSAERAALAKQITDEARVEGEAAEAAALAAREKGAAIVAEKEKQLAALARTRAAAEAEAARAVEAERRAVEQQALTRDYLAPAARTRQEARDIYDASRDGGAPDGAGRGQAAIDRDAAAMARDIRARLETARPGTGGSEVVQTLQAVQRLLEGGLDSTESGAMRVLLGNLEKLTGLSAQTRAEIDAVTARAIDLDRRLVQLQSQFAANR